MSYVKNEAEGFCMRQQVGRRIGSLLLCISIILGFGSSLSFAEPDNTSEKLRIVIGDDYNYPPYSFYNDKGEPTGFNIEIAKAAAEAMGYEVSFELAPWSEVKRSLLKGDLDLISGMFYSKERSQQYTFSTKHTISSGDIFSNNGKKISNLNDLDGKTVIIQSGDIIGDTLRNMGLNIQFIEVATVSDGIEMLHDKKAEYAALFKLPGIYEVKQKGYSEIESSNLLLSPGDYCFAAKKGNDDLILNMNAGLQIIKATGEYGKIYDKWLGVYEEKSPLQLIQKYYWVALILAGIIVFLIGNVILLKQMVDKKTKDLLQAHEELQAEHEEVIALHEEQEASMEELMAIEEELREQFEKVMISERNLAKSEARNRAIIEAIPDLIFTLSKDGTFKDCMVSNEEDLMMPKEAFIGRNLIDILPRELADRGQLAILRALDSLELQSFDYEISINDERKVFEMRIVKYMDDEVIAFTRNISAQKNYQEKIEFLSYHDQLTGLYNRRFFEEELNRLDHPRNYPLCVVMADVNGLKLINDSLGHFVGDELLVKMADVLKMTCRAGEIISRIGGDEFVILLPNTDKAQAEQLVRRIKATGERESLYGMTLSMSFGWEVKQQPEEDIHDIFNRAEGSMYKQKLYEGPSIRGKTVSAIINTLHEKNRQAEEHSQRVSDLCYKFATVLELPQHQIEEIKNVGLLHDIGKIGIDEALLNKPGHLSKEEYDEMKRHPEVGYRILKAVDDMSDMAEYVLGHHEHWDGGGYPRGISGKSIPLQSRMIAIVDAFDAMTSTRTYRKAMTEQQAVSELFSKAGRQFDPELIHPFVSKVLNMDVSMAFMEERTR